MTTQRFGGFGCKARAHAKQDWQVGEIVNVGFIKGLMVVRKEPTPGDWAPDAWLLVSKDNRHYRFVPHLGIERIS